MNLQPPTKGTRMTDPIIKGMGKEVFSLLMEPGIFSLEDFKRVFADVAHKNDIWHHKEKDQYNYFFRQTMKEVKSLIRTANRKKEKQQNTPKKEGKGKIQMPELDSARLRYNRELF